MIRKLITTSAVALALTCSLASAQSLAKFGTDNRSRAIGELTDTQLMAVLKANGRVSMSGTFLLR